MDVVGTTRKVAPVRATFDQVAPAERQDLPLWMRTARDASPSEPPQSAAALLYSSEDLESHIPSNAELATEVSQFWPLPTRQQQVLEHEVSELHAAIASLKHTESELLDQLTPHLVRLTQLIAARVIMNEAQSDPELPLRLVRDGLNLLNHDGQVSVILGSAFEPASQLLETELWREGIQCDVRVLEQVSPFTCYVSAQVGFVDASLETRLGVALQNFLPHATAADPAAVAGGTPVSKT